MTEPAAAAAAGAADGSGSAPEAEAGVAAAVLAQFAALPKTGKPQAHEHTVLAGIVLSLPPPQKVAGRGSRGGDAGGTPGGAGSEPPAASAEQRQQQQQTQQQAREVLAVVALGTGTKCLGAGKRLPGGVALNDCHAEALCRRALLRWLYNEMQGAVHQYTAAAAQQTAAGNSDPAALRAAAATRVLRLVPPSGSGGGTATGGALCGGWRFELQPGVRLHMYVSQPPCGDASILGLAAGKEQQEAVGAAVGGSAGAGGGGYGRTGAKPLKRQRLGAAQQQQQQQQAQQHNTQQQQQRAPQVSPQWAVPQQHEVESYAEEQPTGVVRRKPGRGDATLSLACSDKLARWCLLGLQGSLLSGLLAAPLHLASVTVGVPPPAAPAEQPAPDGRAEVAAPAEQPAPDGRAEVAAPAEQPAPDGRAEVAAAAKAALRRALVGRTAQLARERLPPGWQQAPPALRVHLPALAEAASGCSLMQELGLAPSPARKVAGGSAVIWVGPPSSAFKFKPPPQQQRQQQWQQQPAAAACEAGVAAAAAAAPTQPALAAVLIGGTVEAVAGGNGLKLGAARVQPGQPPHPSAQPSVCKTGLFSAWRQLMAALQRLPTCGAAARDGSAQLPAAPAPAAAAAEAAMPAAPAAPAAVEPAASGLSYRAAKRQAGAAYTAAWAALLAPPSPLEGWIPKPPELEEFGAAADPLPLPS